MQYYVNICFPFLSWIIFLIINPIPLCKILICWAQYCDSQTPIEITSISCDCPNGFYSVYTPSGAGPFRIYLIGDENGEVKAKLGRSGAWNFEQNTPFAKLAAQFLSQTELNFVAALQDPVIDIVTDINFRIAHEYGTNPSYLTVRYLEDLSIPSTICMTHGNVGGYQNTNLLYRPSRSVIEYEEEQFGYNPFHSRGTRPYRPHRGPGRPYGPHRRPPNPFWRTNILPAGQTGYNPYGNVVINPYGANDIGQQSTSLVFDGRSQVICKSQTSVSPISYAPYGGNARSGICGKCGTPYAGQSSPDFLLESVDLGTVNGNWFIFTGSYYYVYVTIKNCAKSPSQPSNSYQTQIPGSIPNEGGGSEIRPGGFPNVQPNPFTQFPPSPIQRPIPGLPSLPGQQPNPFTQFPSQGGNRQPLPPFGGIGGNIGIQPPRQPNIPPNIPPRRPHTPPPPPESQITDGSNDDNTQTNDNVETSETTEPDISDNTQTDTGVPFPNIPSGPSGFSLNGNNQQRPSTNPISQGSQSRSSCGVPKTPDTRKRRQIEYGYNEFSRMKSSNKISTRVPLLPKNTTVDQARILYGVPSKRGSWPWQASIRHKGIHLCGGSLVSDKYVITAAHCQFGRRNPSDVTLSFGTLFSGGVTDESEQTRRAVRIIEHENFNQGLKFNNDIAIIELDSPVQFTDYVSPICLPNSEYTPSMLCYVTGYGSTKGTGVENVLNEVALPIITKSQCLDPNWLGDKVNDNMICAGGGEKDSCQGDSGGPFQCLDESQGNVWTLTGIVSWGIDCGKVNKPGVYTNVYLYLDWIQQRIPL